LAGVVRKQPAIAVAPGESPQEFGRRMMAEGQKSYEDVLKLLTHLSTRVAASDQKAVQNWRQSLEGAKGEFDDNEISELEFKTTIQQIYSVLRKNYGDDFMRNPVRGGRRRKTKRSKRLRRKTAKK
jgi:hypothetical protein